MTCAERSLVDAHFAGKIAPRDERLMRTHLDGCDPCRERYRKRQLLAMIDPGAPTTEERIGRPLGLMPKPRALPVPLPLVAAAIALAALVLFMIRPPKNAAQEREDGFTPRGSVVGTTTTATSKISVYRANKDSGAVVLAQGPLQKSDELAFSYDNASNKSYLMVFGVDDAGRVYWFYPAWTNEAENPMSLKIEPGRVAQLPEAIRHGYAGERLTIHGLFLDTPLTVRDVEIALRDKRLESGIPGAIDQTFVFEVAR